MECILYKIKPADKLFPILPIAELFLTHRMLGKNFSLED